jgi:hypothetical protein
MMRPDKSAMKSRPENNNLRRRFYWRRAVPPLIDKKLMTQHKKVPQRNATNEPIHLSGYFQGIEISEDSGEFSDLRRNVQRRTHLVWPRRQSEQETQEASRRTSYAEQDRHV